METIDPASTDPVGCLGSGAVAASVGCGPDLSCDTPASLSVQTSRGRLYRVELNGKDRIEALTQNKDRRPGEG